MMDVNMNDIMNRCRWILIMPGDYIRKHDCILSDTGEMKYTIIIWHNAWWDMLSFDCEFPDLSQRDLIFDCLCNGTSMVIGMQTFMIPVEFDSFGIISPANIMDYRIGDIMGGCEDE